MGTTFKRQLDLAYGLLSGDIDATETSFSLASGSRDFGEPVFVATIGYPGSNGLYPDGHELVLVTGYSGNSISACTRSYGGTTAPEDGWAEGTPVRLNASAVYYDDLAGAINDIEDGTTQIVLTSPGAIGAVAPNTGKFTTGQFTGAVTASAATNVINVGSNCTMTIPPPIGAVTPNTGKFTTLTATGGAIDGTTHGATTPIVSEIVKALSVRDDATLGPELVTDGDCEATPGSWTSYYSPPTNERSATVAHGGTYSRKVVTDSASDGIYQDVAVAACVGARYRVTFWYYGASGTLSVRMDNGATAVAYTLTPTWTQATVYFIMTATGQARLVFYDSSGAGITFHIDDVSCKRVGGDARVNGFLGVGGAATFNAGQVTLATAYPSASDRLLGAGTNAVVPVSRVIAQTTGDMADGFGPSLQFEATDSGAANKVLGGIGAVRDGADTEGKLVFYAGTAGAEAVGSIDHDGTMLVTRLNVNTGGFALYNNDIHGLQEVYPSSAGSVNFFCEDGVSINDENGTVLHNGELFVRKIHCGASDIDLWLGPTVPTIYLGNSITIVDATLTSIGSIEAVAMVCGADGTVRGSLSLWDGSGGNQASYILLHSRNGTAHYLWVEDDGTIKQSTAAPVDNADGNVVGAQT